MKLVGGAGFVFLVFYGIIWLGCISGTLQFSLLEKGCGRMKSDFRPILVAIVTPQAGGIMCLCEDGQVEIGAQTSRKVWQILEYCDGYNDMRAIVVASGLSFEEVARMVEDLMQLGVLKDVDEVELSRFEPIARVAHYMRKIGEDDWPVKDCWLNTFGEENRFIGATSVYLNGSGKRQYVGATGATRAEAMLKAMFEGYGRWASEQARVDFHGKVKYLQDHWLDPREIMPLTFKQAKKSGLKTFNKELPIDWTIGRNYDGTVVFVPSDLVYHGRETRENRIYWGHSSGVAAYTNFDEAVKLATVELIERDALMRSWYLRKKPKIVSQRILPTYVMKRVLYWYRRCRKMMVLEVPSEYGWVFEVIVVSDVYPCFVSGTAATIDREDILKTMVRAMEEAEYNLCLAIQYPCDYKVDPQAVATPMMHETVYHLSRYAKKLEWLWSGEMTNEITERAPHELGELESKLKLVTVDLSVLGSELKVARVFSPKLVPINFGFNTAHYTHPEIRGKIDPESLESPHCFG